MNDTQGWIRVIEHAIRDQRRRVGAKGQPYVQWASVRDMICAAEELRDRGRAEAREQSF